MRSSWTSLGAPMDEPPARGFLGRCHRKTEKSRAGRVLPARNLQEVEAAVALTEVFFFELNVWVFLF